MPLSREISRPIGTQPPEVVAWKNSLRTPRSPSPGRRGSFGSSNRNMATGSLKRSNSRNSLRGSTGNLAASLNSSMNKSGTLGSVESEYIKNLQQQVYFLELEANYLREQARKATDMHPQMTAEAERMLAKLRLMQTEVDGLHVEVRRKEDNLDIVATEKQRVLSQLEQEETSHAREKRLLMDEIVQLKKDNDTLHRETTRKDSEIIQANAEIESGRSALRNAEHKVSILRNQLDQRIEQHKLTQLALEEKRAEVLRTEGNLRELEDKYYNNTVILQDKAMQELRDEIRMLRQRLKETEMNAEQDRYLKNKMSEDSSHLVKENALLNTKILELQKELDRERDLRVTTDARRSTTVNELVATKERERQLELELRSAQDQLRGEQSRVHSYMDKLAETERLASTSELNASATRSRLVELENLHQNTEEENAKLRRDKALLVDHTSGLQKQVTDKEAMMLQLRGQIQSLEGQVTELEHLKDIESQYHSKKWEDFEKLADSMKNLSRNMAASTSPRSARSPIRLKDF